MKRLYFALLFIFVLTVSANGQPRKGDWSVGVGGSMDFAKPNDFYTIPSFSPQQERIENDWDFQLTAQGGYSISDRWQIGLMLGYAHRRYQANWLSLSGRDFDSGEYEAIDVAGEEYKQKGFLIGPYGRCFFRINKTLSLGIRGNLNILLGNASFGEGHASIGLFGFDIISSDGFSEEMKTFGISANLTPEIWLNISRRVAVSLSIFEAGYYYQKWDAPFIDVKGQDTRKDSTSDFKFLYAKIGVGISYNF